MSILHRTLSVASGRSLRLIKLTASNLEGYKGTVEALRIKTRAYQPGFGKYEPDRLTGPPRTPALQSHSQFNVQGN